MAKLNSPSRTTIEVDGDMEFNGTTVANTEKGTWNVHGAPNAMIYLHNSVGIEAAMKLYIWEDVARSKKEHIKVTKNASGRVVGVVVRSGYGA